MHLLRLLSRQAQQRRAPHLSPVLLRRRHLSLPPTIRQVLAAPVVAQDAPSPAPSPAPAPATAPSTVTVHGHLLSVRRQKSVAFLHITDGTTLEPLQAVLTDPEDALGLNAGCSVRVTGELVRSVGRGQRVELRVPPGGSGEGVRVVGACDVNTYPLQMKQIRPETLRENAHLRARTARMAAVLRVRDGLARAMHAWFGENGFCNVATPILTSSDCEGAGEVFRVRRDRAVGPGDAEGTASPGEPIAGSDSDATTSETPSYPPSPTHPPSPTAPPTSSPPPRTIPPEFFRRPTFLTVSGQLQLEALASALSRVYTLSPAFRAEPSLTHRHLSEFWMLEAEMGYLGEAGLDGVMDVVEESVKRVLRGVLAGEGLEAGLEADVRMLRAGGGVVGEGEGKGMEELEKALENSWERITYAQAIRLLQRADEGSEPARNTKMDKKKKRFEFRPAHGLPLQSEHEKWLAAHYGGPVFVTHYPAALKPFYMRRIPGTSPGTGEGDGAQKQTAQCFDLLVPGVGELAGGSLREDRLELLEAALDEAGLSREEYAWYLDLRRFGGVPTGGYGLGWERLVSWITGVENVRDCIPFPRWAGNIVL